MCAVEWWTKVTTWYISSYYKCW